MLTTSYVLFSGCSPTVMLPKDLPLNEPVKGRMLKKSLDNHVENDIKIRMEGLLERMGDIIDSKLHGFLFFSENKNTCLFKEITLGPS